MIEKEELRRKGKRIQKLLLKRLNNTLYIIIEQNIKDSLISNIIYIYEDNKHLLYYHRYIQ